LKSGTLKFRLKLPPLLTVGEPTVWPLNVTSAVSPGVNPDPSAVIFAPARPDGVDNASEAVGTVVALGCDVATGAGGVGAGAPVPWPSADSGIE